MFKSIVSALISLFVVASAAADPINLDEPIIDQARPYLGEVAFLQEVRRRGYLRPSGVSIQMYPSLDAALVAVRSTRFASTLYPRATAGVLEENSLWWTEISDPTISLGRGEPLPIWFFVHNRTSSVISGVIMEFTDADCDFRAQRAKTYYVIPLREEGTLRPNDAALYNGRMPTLPHTFSTAGGMWCMIIVRAF